MAGTWSGRGARARAGAFGAPPHPQAGISLAFLVLLLLGFPATTATGAARPAGIPPRSGQASAPSPTAPPFRSPAATTWLPLAQAATELQAGDETTVRGDNIRLRATPSDFGNVVAILPRGEAIVLTGAAEDAGSVWWPVEVVATGDRGWLKWIAVTGGSPILGVSPNGLPALGDEPASPAAPADVDPGRPRGRGFKGVVAQAFAELDAFWADQAAAGSWRYRPPELRRFGAPKETRCGPIAPGNGPAYCPLDEAIYIDMAFLEQSELVADPFLVKVIMAHEWAHHVQQLAGFAKAIFPDEPGEVFNIQLELHADCLAGVWVRAAEATGDATPDDILRAATLALVLGDTPDALVIDPAAHGSGEMRLGAFAIGYDGVGVDACADLLDP